MKKPVFDFMFVALLAFAGVLFAERVQSTRELATQPVLPLNRAEIKAKSLPAASSGKILGKRIRKQDSRA
jgi:hypothetical protein